MKNIKKILSLVIVLSILMSSFSALAVNLNPDTIIDDIFKFDMADFLNSGKDDQAGEDGEGEVVIDPDMERILFLNTLGIWDDPEKSKDALLTMTEFSIIMSKFKLGSQNALVDVYTKNENTDNVTFKQAYEYMLEALGYYYKCAQYGDGDRASLIVAAEIGLLSANPENINTYITRNELAKLITRGLTIDLSVIEYGDVGYSYEVVPGKNILNTVHGIHEIDGFVNAIPGLAIYGSAETRTNFIQINRTEVFTGDMDLRDYFGKTVDAFAKYDPLTNQHNLVYICVADDYKELVIDFKNIISVNSTEIKYLNEEEKEDIFRTGSLKYILENGNKLDSIADMGSFTNNEGKIILTSSENGVMDTALIYRYNYYTALYNDLNNLRIGLKFDQEFDGLDYIQMNDKAVNDIYIDGASSTFDQIETNSSMRIFRSNSGYTRIDVSTVKLNSPAEELYEDTVVIEGKEYILTRDVKLHVERSKTDLSLDMSDKIPEITLGTPATFYVLDNMIVAYTMNTDYRWGYLRGATTGRSTLDTSLSLKIFTDESTWINAPVAEKIELDGVKGQEREYVRERLLGNADTVFDELIRFKLNADEELIALDTALITLPEVSTTDDVEKVSEHYGSVNWRKWYWAGSKYFSDNKTKVFVIPEDRSEEAKYQAVTNASLPYTSGDPKPQYRFTFYNPDDYLHLGAMIFHGELGAGGSSIAYYLHVESIREIIIDPEKFEYGYKLVGKQYTSQSEGRGTVTSSSLIVPKEMFEAKPVGVGDFITAKYALGFIATEYRILFPGGIVPDDSVTGSGAVNVQKIQAGTIEKVDYARQYIIMNQNGEQVLFMPSAKAIIDVENDKSIPATISDFHPGDRVAIVNQEGIAGFVFKNEKNY